MHQGLIGLPLIRLRYRLGNDKHIGSPVSHPTELPEARSWYKLVIHPTCERLAIRKALAAIAMKPTNNS